LLLRQLKAAVERGCLGVTQNQAKAADLAPSQSNSALMTLNHAEISAAVALDLHTVLLLDQAR
jgi:hypothetical protein